MVLDLLWFCQVLLLCTLSPSVLAYSQQEFEGAGREAAWWRWDRASGLHQARMEAGGLAGGCSGWKVLQQCWDRPSGLALQGWKQVVSPGRSSQLRMGPVLGVRKFLLEPALDLTTWTWAFFFFFLFFSFGLLSFIFLGCMP